MTFFPARTNAAPQGAAIPAVPSAPSHPVQYAQPLHFPAVPHNVCGQVPLGYNIQPLQPTYGPVIMSPVRVAPPAYIGVVLPSVSLPSAQPQIVPAASNTRETLGTTGGITTRAMLGAQLKDVKVKEGDNDKLLISFNSKDSAFRLGFRQTDGSYSDGGYTSNMKGIDSMGRTFETSSIKMEGRYVVHLSHKADGSIDYTISVDRSIDRLRLDVGGKSMLLDVNELREPEAKKSLPPEPLPVPRTPERLKVTPPPTEVPLPGSLPPPPNLNTPLPGTLEPSRRTEPTPSLPGALPPPPK